MLGDHHVELLSIVKAHQESRTVILALYICGIFPADTDISSHSSPDVHLKQRDGRTLVVALCVEVDPVRTVSTQSIEQLHLFPGEEAHQIFLVRPSQHRRLKLRRCDYLEDLYFDGGDPTGGAGEKGIAIGVCDLEIVAARVGPALARFVEGLRDHEVVSAEEGAVVAVAVNGKVLLVHRDLLFIVETDKVRRAVYLVSTFWRTLPADTCISAKSSAVVHLEYGDCGPQVVAS